MKNYTVLLLFLSSITLFAQGEEKKDTVLLNQWIMDGITGLNISQISFSDWSQGGENSFTYSVFGNFGLRYVDSSWAFKNSLIITYGQSKIGDGDFKVNDNDFYLESVYSRRIGWLIDPYVSNSVRTTITAGYNYSDTSKVKIADFFDPGYVTQSIGFMYDKDKAFKTRLGVAFQETFADKQRYITDDIETPDEIEAFKFESGFESVTDLNLIVSENLRYDTKLRLFTRFEAMDVWDVRWDNLVTSKVTDIINVSLNVILIYEKAQSPKTQIKQALQIGIVYKLF